MFTKEVKLNHPVNKNFMINIVETSTKTYEVEVEQPDGTIRVETKESEITEKKPSEILSQANSIRLLDVLNEPDFKRMTIRYIYGNSDSGKFEPAANDEGVVISGSTYLESQFGRNPTELQILSRLVELMKFDGKIQERGA